ncbi:hypothetical protein OO007_18360 [Cocleimonas sp. KMM 6892]|uniref:hypothetical protein n=1 Tax=unclassified Cocleimonas TaxID=2639732 RepID=UPI002DBB20F0|nr:MULTISPECIES: hypothetical protein [unclassified Cocleimonas]MEB8434206.1 hypothetical protein [Cocleimonas sp. KMM 6892]MEC4717175.1 hypothetical protein [Cocleimonas sp. KMM 6895]MEC4746478.1 hypothetical protein [Cocleimonas sp. KMM 6896]
MLKTFLRFIPTLLGILFSILANELMAAGLIVNEASNGISGAKEFYEFMVVGDSANPTSPVNIDQWIVDDNNGDWGGSITGVGISSGYIRFDSQTDPANCSGLNAITPGSIIVVYNGDDTNANIPSDDATDSNGDGVYIFPAEGSCLKTCAGPPSSSDAGYSSCSTAATPNYSTIAMRNGGDSAQSRDASGNLFHGFTYGDIPSPYPTNSFNVSTGSGSVSTFLFSCGSWYIGSNFSKISAIADTPGSTNNAANEIFRTNIQSGSFNYSNLSDAANCAVLSDPSISLRKSALTISDPINGTSNPKTIPGALKQYAIEATNAGIGVADLNSIVVTDAIPANTALYVDDISGVSTGPIRFVDGSPPSGLSYNYAGLSSASDNLSFSNNGGSNYTYTPTPDADGVDANVTHIRVSTTGQFLGTTVAGDPSFQLLFRVRVE